MRSYHWAKIWIEILDDRKMGVLSDRLWRRAIESILLAKEQDAEGWLPPLHDMAWRLRMSPEMLESDLVELAKVAIVEQRNGGWFVTNFEKRQSKMTAAERKARQRERDKKLDDGHIPVTSLSHDSHDIVTKRDTGNLPPQEVENQDVTICDSTDIIVDKKEDIRKDKIREDPLSQYVTGRKINQNGAGDPVLQPAIKTIVDWWMALVGIGKPADPQEAEEKLYGPAESLIKRLDGDVPEAKGLIESKRDWMIDEKGWTPKWLSGVIPHVLADLDKVKAEPKRVGGIY